MAGVNLVLISDPVIVWQRVLSPILPVWEGTVVDDCQPFTFPAIQILNLVIVWPLFLYFSLFVSLFSLIVSLCCALLSAVDSLHQYGLLPLRELELQCVCFFFVLHKYAQTDIRGSLQIWVREPPFYCGIIMWLEAKIPSANHHSRDDNSSPFNPAHNKKHAFIHTAPYFNLFN